jgi:arabinofuranan 3-O-arabinosyltransferase
VAPSSGSAVVAALARLAGLVLAVSCYWMIPAAFAFGTATGVVDNTETVEAISGVSSYSEVLRGLGMWTMYGTSPTTGPWQPGFAAYLDNPFVIMASFASPPWRWPGSRCGGTAPRHWPSLSPRAPLSSWWGSTR